MIHIKIGALIFIGAFFTGALTHHLAYTPIKFAFELIFIWRFIFVVFAGLVTATLLAFGTYW